MTAVVVNTTIPRVLKKTASNSASTAPSGHFCEGPLLAAMCDRAGVLTQPGNFFKKHSERHGQGALTAIYFNSFRYALTLSRTLRSCRVTSELVTRYSKSKEGELMGFRRIEDIEPRYLSLHEVLVLVDVQQTRFNLPLTHNVSKDQINIIRGRYRCDCKAFWSTGWLCSHVVATMALLDGLDIVAACAQLSMNRPRGRPRKDKGCLDSTTHARYFSKPRLLKLLESKHAHPLGWNVVRQLLYTGPESNEQTTRTVRGEIEGWIPPGRRGNVKWLVKFKNGETLQFKLEDLVDLIVYSKVHDLNVTGELKKLGPISCGHLYRGSRRNA
ncbi:hypothetical protein PF005_g26341 [Phytophthora fragariae]|nr:hypothetical protein PF011_g27508 [Phytophthora fragariae]KAE9063618.1 hypothetical protein PF007_g29491 [Phytophthora fragariae]KAE9103509.1 hypothetical protein PF006_g22157 [Phytophthora fragariae]KAE9173263.1 hypothetical protein PF005_g26341 [Phytophthora fragariae]